MQDEDTSTSCMQKNADWQLATLHAATSTHNPCLDALSCRHLGRGRPQSRTVQTCCSDKHILSGACLYMTVRSMATTGCTVELLDVPRKMTATKMAPITFSTSPCEPLHVAAPAHDMSA